MGLTWKGRPFNAQAFAEELKAKVIAVAMDALLRRARNAAASIVDPETGKHPLVFAWQTPPHGVRVSTTGSERYAMALETRLDRERRAVGGELEDAPVVYFAHASEDKVAAKAIAEHLLANGIDVWFDEWEIGAGDSLRRKMDEGLGSCTHFVVLLSPVALTKPWVNEEIDAGFVQRVEGKSKFIPLRLNLTLMALPPLLKGMLSPDIAPDNEPALQQLVAQIFGVTSKPPLGAKPRYVQKVGELAHFSSASVTIGKHLVSTNQSGMTMDPQLDFDDLAAATGLPLEDVEIGVLDLVQAGLIEESGEIGGTTIWPRGPLFVTFDEHVHDWKPAEDARSLAVAVVNGGKREYDAAEIAEMLGWPRRRLNAAFHAVEAADLATVHKFLDGGQWAISLLEVTAQTRRAVRAA